MEKKQKIIISSVCILFIICVGVYLSCLTLDNEIQEDDNIAKIKSCDTEYGILVGTFRVIDQKLLYYDYSVGKLTYEEKELDGMNIKIIDTEMRDGPPMVSIVDINGERIYARTMTYDMQPGDDYSVRDKDGSSKTIATQISSYMIENCSLITYNDNWYVICHSEITNSWEIYRMKIGKLIYDINDVTSSFYAPHSYGECMDDGIKMSWENCGWRNGGSLYIRIEIGEKSYTYFIRHDITSNLKVGTYLVYFIPDEGVLHIKNRKHETIAVITARSWN